jgi:ATP-dependent protease ClpP protease subunit
MNYKLDRKTIKKRPDDPIYYVHECDIDIFSNHIYLFGAETYATGTSYEGGIEPGVEYVMANRFIRNLQLCMRANPKEPIIIHMKTNGGDVHEGMAIYDAIKTCPVPITILSYTHARSMSSIILQAADRRVLMPSSYFMFHDGTLGAEGTFKTVVSFVEFQKRYSDKIEGIYIESMRNKGFKKTDSERKRWLRDQMDKKEDVFLMPDEAVSCGFADEIFNGNWDDLGKV